MLKLLLSGLVVSSLATSVFAQSGRFASSVISYNPGTGFATEFGSGAGFTNATAALGEASRVTPGQFGGPVDPFSPPYLKEQLVSIGTGGSLTVGFSSPVLNNPLNPFGLDFIIFGSAGFVITNGNFSGGGITDGSLFGANSGTTRISVSADNVTYYTLDPNLAPTVDALFPTDGNGDFSRAVDPALNGSSFSGADLSAIRLLYGGSGGGAGFDIAWARDNNGQPVSLSGIQYLRIDVPNGVAEIDAIAAVPEPSTYVIIAAGVLCFYISRRSIRRSHLA